MKSKDQQGDVRQVVRESEKLLGGPQIFRGKEIFFPTKERTTRIRVQSAKALLPTLKKALEPGEVVLFISARGFTFYLWEQLFGAGAWAGFVNATTLVLTDRRILAFNVKNRGRTPKDIKNAIPLSEIKSVRGFGALLTLQLRDGKYLRVSGLTFADAKELKARLGHEVENMDAATSTLSAGGKSLQHLCPVCCKPIEKVDSLQCPSCRSEFRSGRKAALRSLLLPGLGNIYLKHTMLGVLELIGSIIVWLVVIGALIMGEPGAIITALVILVAVNGADYLVTRAMARKGIVAK